MNFSDLDELEPYISQLSTEQLEELYSGISDFDTNPVGINEFLESDKYLGNYFDGGLYPYWKKVLNEIYPSPHNSPYWLVCFRGSIGQGKTSIACAGVAYDLYRLLCLNNPQKKFGLLPSTTILFAIFNVTMSLSVDVCWDKLSQMFAQSPYFSSLTGLLGARKRKGETLFPKRIDFFMGSRITHSLGKAVFDAILSEANFEVIEGQVYETFNSLLRRMESRFMLPGGAGIPGKLWIDSSETDKFSVMNKLIDQYRNKKGVYISQAPIWEVKNQHNGRPLYSGNRFWVYKGSDLKQPKVLEDQDRTIQDESEFCIQVPVEHRDAFEADIHAALKDIAGVATISNYKVFRLKDRLLKSLSVSPLFPETIRLDFDDNDDQLINYILAKGYFNKPLNPSIPRNIHIDIGLTGDRLGIAATYVAGFKDRTVRDTSTFDEITENVPCVITEWAIGVEPKPGKQIPLYKIRMFISFLSKIGYPIGVISLDGFQSADFLQLMTKEGFECELVSTDKKIDPYMVLRTLIYESRSMLPIHSILETELKELEMSSDGQKVDHPEKNVNGSHGCFSGDTRVRLLNGTTPTLKELADNYKGEFIHVFTVRDGDISVGVAHSPRLTKKAASTVIVTLDSGEKITCTEDHRFLLRDGRYKEAKDLVSGESLMPLYLKVSEGDMKGYLKYKRLKKVGYSFVHRMVGKVMNPKYKGNQFSDLVVHHEKGKLDNDPRSLKVITKQEHREIHRFDILNKRKNIDFENKRLKGLEAYNKGNKENQSKLLKTIHQRPDFREALLKRVGNIGKRTGPENLTRYNKSKAHRKLAGEIGKRTIRFAIDANRRKDITVDRIKETARTVSYLSEVYKNLKCSEKCVYRILKEAHISTSEIKKLLIPPPRNHKVSSVESGPLEDVYDLTVLETENFALAAGVFVHNSKDIADAVAASTFVTVRDSHKHKLLHLVENRPKNAIGDELVTLLWPNRK